MPHADPVKRRAYVRQWLKKRTPAQKAKALEYQREWERQNPEKTRARFLRWLATHREQEAARQGRWQKENRETVALNTRLRKARKRSAVHPEMDWDKERTMFVRAQRLTRQTEILHVVDHIIPIIAGGWHHHDNLQILPNLVNCSKNDDPFWEKSGYKSWRDVPQKLWPAKLVLAYLALLI